MDWAEKLPGVMVPDSKLKMSPKNLVKVRGGSLLYNEVRALRYRLPHAGVAHMPSLRPSLWTCIFLTQTYCSLPIACCLLLLVIGLAPSGILIRF